MQIVTLRQTIVKMIFTDTHVHLYSEEFSADRSQMMDRALAAGVERFFMPAIHRETAEAMWQMEADYPGKVFAMMGLHPVYVKPDSWQEELAFVKSELHRRDYCAVGEIGIDLYWDKSTLKMQQEVFSEQISWAKSLGKPINIHCRDAFDEVFEVLETHKGEALRGIFHCFTGSYEQALRALSLQMKLGIGGVATFKNGKIDQFLAQIPLTEIVLETDAPYLAPAPYRGKRNESGYLLKVAEKLSSIYRVPLRDIARQTTENSRSVYGI